MREVHPRRLQLVAQAGAAGTGPERVVGPVHDVVGEQLRAAVEQLAEGLLAVLGVEDVLLLDRYPGQVAPLLGDRSRELRVLSLEFRQLVASSLPFLPCCDLVVVHSVSSSRMSQVRTEPERGSHRSRQSVRPRTPTRERLSGSRA